MGRAFIIYHYNTEIVQSQCVLAENLKVLWAGGRTIAKGLVNGWETYERMKGGRQKAQGRRHLSIRQAEKVPRRAQQSTGGHRRGRYGFCQSVEAAGD